MPSEEGVSPRTEERSKTEVPPRTGAVRPTVTPTPAPQPGDDLPSRKRRRHRAAENAIRPSLPRTREAPPPKEHASGRDAPPATRSDRLQASIDRERIPEEVSHRFVQVGRHYHFPDGTRAFTDRGARLTTRSENTEVVRTLVSIAKERGWNDITVTGSERFRKDAWFAGKMAGLEVRGYRPTEFEREHLAREVARSRAASPSPTPRDAASGERAEPKAPEAARARGDQLRVGRLVDHGRASYRHDPNEPMSYFAKIETERGERTVWGVDLERAFKESLTKPKLGDEVGLSAFRQEAVTVKTLKKDASGALVGEHELHTHRNRWIVEKREFFEARAQAADAVRNPSIGAREAVKERPELAGTYLYLRGAEEIARRRIRDPEDQRRFVATVRGALADSVARGEPLPVVRLRDRAQSKEREAYARA
jgi:putative DNA primase/helicase